MMMAAMMARDPALDDLRYYLQQWRRWVRAWAPPLGVPGAVAWVGQMLPSVSGGEDTDLEVDAEIMRKVDSSVESLPKDMRAAVRFTYLNEILPAVFRSGRMTRETARRLCDEAELELVLMLRARNVVLGGR